MESRQEQAMSRGNKHQIDKVKEAARELECDDDDVRFDAAVPGYGGEYGTRKHDIQSL